MRMTFDQGNVAHLFAKRPELAEVLGIGDDTLRRWIRTARLNENFPVHTRKVGRVELFHVPSFSAWATKLLNCGAVSAFPRRSA